MFSFFLNKRGNFNILVNPVNICTVIINKKFPKPITILTYVISYSNQDLDKGLK